MIERTVTFEAWDSRKDRSTWASVGFTIQPPINAHNPDFLQEKVIESGLNNLSNGDEVVGSVCVNFSDSHATYGAAEVNPTVGAETVQHVITESFGSALSVGGASVVFAFKENAPKP